MAGKMKKQRKELLIGAGALALVLCVLLAVVFCMPEDAVDTLPDQPEQVPAANPYGPEDFQYRGKYLTCLSGESVLGIDVSSHQGVIDWQQVADAGMEFVMIRVGYRGYETGLLNADELAHQNYEGAKAAGLQVGAYFFSQAVTPEEAAEEAEFVLEQISRWEVDMPVVFDWEYLNQEARTGNVDGDTVMACTRAFNDRIQEAGYAPMIYFNPYQAQTFLDLEALAEYPFWLALYSDRMTYDYQVDMWQYTSQGTVPGIEGPVDINLWFPREGA